MGVPIYIPIKNAGEFPSLPHPLKHVLLAILWDGHSDWGEVIGDSSLDFLFVFL